MVESRRQKKANAAAEKESKKTLPMWWKALMYGATIWSGIGGSLYASGFWASKMYACTVEISTLDSWMADSIVVGAMLAVITIFGGMYHLEN